MAGAEVWKELSDVLSQLLTPAIVTAVMAAFLKFFRPRKVIGFVVAVWNYEKIVANANEWMEEAERQEQWGKRWMNQYQSCQEELSRMDSEILRLRKTAYHRYDDGGS